MKIKSYATAVALGSLALFAMPGFAAQITWQTSVDVTADTDVSTDGVLRIAVNGAGTGTAPVEVNGVPFENAASPSALPFLSGTAKIDSTHNNQADTAFGRGSLPATTDDEIGDLMIGALYGGSAGNNRTTITFSDLVVGQEYQIQMFVNDARTGASRSQNWQNGYGDGTQSFDDSLIAGTSGAANMNNRDPLDLTMGELAGDYIIGTFTADDVEQSFEFAATRDITTGAYVHGNQAQLNALQLRALDPVLPLPESDANLWTGTIDANLDNVTDNFALNDFDDALLVGNLADVVADDGEAIFSDQYFALDVGTPVTNFDLTIPNGAAPVAGLLSFESAYSVTSVDAIGIDGATVVQVADADTDNLGNGGDLTLLGTHIYTGFTSVNPDCTLQLGNPTASTVLTGSNLIVNGEATYDTTVADVTFAGSLSGSGTFEKIGPNTLTLTDAGTGFVGNTIITAGTIIAEENFTSSNVMLSAGTVLEYRNTGGPRTAGEFTGDGTLRFSGTGLLQIRSLMSLGPDANIEISTGTTLKASGAFAGVWTANQADIDVASGATLRGDEATVFVDALTGEGDVTTGWNTVYTGFTVGVADGSGTFEGTFKDSDATQGHNAILRKVGTGTQTISGFTSHHGDTIVEDGALVFETDAVDPLDGSSITFYPEASTVSNQVRGEGAGTGALILDSFMDIDVTNADLTLGNFWVLVDPSNLAVTYGPNFQPSDLVSLNAGAAVTDYIESSPGIWSFTDLNGVEYNFEESTGILFIGEPFEVITDPITITSCGLNGTGGFDVTIENLSSATTYQLRRSADLEDEFPTDVGAPFTGGNTNTFTDAAPPAGKAFYQLFEVAP